MTPRRRDPVDRPSLDFETRKEIFEHVEANPGTHFNQLKRDLDMETGLLQHHLDQLEKASVLQSEDHQGKRRVFVARELNEEERSILSVLRYETTRQILLYLLEYAPARNGEIADAVDVTPATVSWHLSSLVETDIVESVRDGRTTYYQVANEDLVVQLLVRYQESFVDRAVDRILDFWG